MFIRKQTLNKEKSLIYRPGTLRPIVNDDDDIIIINIIIIIIKMTLK
jgi:hypothetical protein